ncbi:Retroviral aspartyl protease [Lasallia pustulata]|uniref:RNA-directed DNA polymerase n=1 Tax=Lasallia pustulata TaxID=136370 RepID=A0A1W5DBJ3_9LECA|nr:Retroviral aspartyl protease [Lasallia pustulata]
MSTTGSTQGGSRAAAPRAEVVTTKSLKLATPIIFTGDYKKLDTFLLQLALYFKFNSSSFATDANKIQYAAYYLQDKAEEWFRPYIQEYTTNEDNPSQAEESTRRMFASFNRFKSEIRMVFGDIDRKHMAERELLQLRQTKSAADYMAHFMRLSAATNWEDAALMAMFYAGLKDAVKDKIARGERPDDLRAVTTMAIRIDNCLYERRKEKSPTTYNDKRKTTAYTSGCKRNKNRHQKNDKYRPRPMEIDTIEPKKKKTFDGDCYNCEIGQGEETQPQNFVMDWLPQQRLQRKEPDTWEDYHLPTISECEEAAAEAQQSRNPPPRIASPAEEPEEDPAQEEGRQYLLTQNSTREHDTIYSIHGQRHAQIKIPVTMGTLDAWAMMDSGATGNFVSERFICDNQIRKTKKAHPYRNGNADVIPNKGNNRWVTHKTSIWMKYEAFEGLIIWDIATIDSAAIILGMPWLRQANPSIDWETRTIEDLRLSLEKSEFHKQEIDFLGYIIRPRELGMDPNKVTAIQEWPEPKTVKEVQAFLGFANFYQRFIERYLQKATPLTNLTKKDQPFQWEDKHQYAFETIKEAFANGKTDASDGALRACLGQRKDKKLVPVAFYSQKLAPAELNYKIYDKELLAIVDALKQWRVYLEGSKAEVKVYSDHKNLESFTTTKVLNRRQVRWSEELAAYHFQIYYQKGSLNGRADALSRRADYVTDIPKTAGQILEVDADGNLAYH